MYQGQEKLLIQKLKTILNSNIFLILLILFCIIKVAYKTNHIKSKYDNNTKSIIGIVTNIKQEEDKSIITLKAKENILVYYYDDITLELGNKIKVNGTQKKFVFFFDSQ